MREKFKAWIMGCGLVTIVKEEMCCRRLFFLTVYICIFILQLSCILENKTEISPCIISKKSQGNREIYSTGFGVGKTVVISFL